MRAEFKGQTFKRILALAKPHLKWVIGFLTTVVLVSILDAYFTFLSKRIVDEGIVARNPSALTGILIQYGGADPGAGIGSVWFHLHGGRDWRTHPL